MLSSDRSATLIWALGAGAAYFLVARGGTLLVADPEGLAAVWPASGVLLAALLASDTRHWRAIGIFTLVAAAASTMVDGDPTPATAVAAAAAWGEGLIAAAIVTRVAHGRPSLSRLRDVAALIAASVLASAAGALVGAAALSSEAGIALGPTWVTWWSADAIGMLAIAPVAIALRESAGRRPSPRAIAEDIVLLAALAGVCLFVFGADPGVGGLRSALPAALVLPLLVFAATRFGAVTVSLGGLLVTIVAARMTIEEHGPFANALASTSDRLLGMRAFLAVAIGTSLAAVALASERRNALRERREQSDRLDRAERERDTEQRRVQELIGTAFDAVITIDEEGIVSDWNPAAQRTFGWSQTEAVGRPLTDTIVPPKLRLPYEAALEVLRRAGEVSGIGQRIELEARHKGGSEVPVELTLSSIRGEGRLSFHLVANDLYELRALEEQRASARARIDEAEARVTESDEERRRVEDELRQARLQAARAELLQRAAVAEHERRLGESTHELQRLERSFEDAPIAMALADAGGQLTRVNASLCELTGLPRERLETITVEELAHPGDRELVRAALRPLLERQRGRWQGEVRLVDELERELPIDLGITILREPDDAPYLLLHAEDLRERRRARERVAFLADHDFLTGLPDRRLLEAELERAAGGAVAVLDLDGLRSINDSLGRPAGDALLAEAGRVLRQRVRKSDTIARIGGDVFAVSLAGAGEDDARRLGEELLDAVRSLRTIDGRPVSASAGVLLFTGAEGLSAEQLVVEAELAVYDAKDAGRNRMVLRRVAGERRPQEGDRGWAERIREALDDDCFILHAQPIVSLKGAPPTRYELLLRVVGDDGDLIPPATFLYVAERFGLAQEIDRWVIGQAAAMLARAQEAGRELLLEVNISAPSVADPGLAELLARELREAKVPGSGLTLAIDEATAIENMESVRALAHAVRSAGCEIVLDHFGSGLASFHYLQQLAVDYVKIDGSFVKDLPHNRAGRMVVKSVVEVAGSLGCRTIAERVGDSETLALLQSQGVDYAQGFFVGRPRPAAELELGSLPPEDGRAVRSL
jgi:diguanylate cyclase (GGDEF)-like protein/PAS domain S-box-containing protein